MLERKVFVLRSREDMLAKLLEVNPEPHAMRGFYPLLLQHAGQKKVPEGIVMALGLAVHDYIKNGGLPRVMGNILISMGPKFIEAMCADPEAVRLAKDHLRSMNDLANAVAKAKPID